MNILVGESTEIGGNYSLFTETQVLSLVWKADPVDTRIASVRDGKEMSVLKSGQITKPIVNADGATVSYTSDVQRTATQALEVIETFKEAIASLGKTKVIDRSDLTEFNFSEVLNATPEAGASAEEPETETE